jgi:hypothetical protein
MRYTWFKWGPKYPQVAFTFQRIDGRQVGLIDLNPFAVRVGHGAPVVREIAIAALTCPKEVEVRT